jgi:Asp-tRNA(Asn)/Glu-tRNA(Gln) amidotransferase B subunit
MDAISFNRTAAKFITNDLAGILKRKGFSVESNPIEPPQLGYMLQLMVDGHLERRDVRLWAMDVCDQATKMLADLREIKQYIMEKSDEKICSV